MLATSTNTVSRHHDLASPRIPRMSADINLTQPCTNTSQRSDGVPGQHAAIQYPWGLTSSRPALLAVTHLYSADSFHALRTTARPTFALSEDVMRSAPAPTLIHQCREPRWMVEVNRRIIMLPQCISPSRSRDCIEKVSYAVHITRKHDILSPEYCYCRKRVLPCEVIRETKASAHI